MTESTPVSIAPAVERVQSGPDPNVRPLDPLGVATFSALPIRRRSKAPAVAPAAVPAAGPGTTEPEAPSQPAAGQGTAPAGVATEVSAPALVVSLAKAAKMLNICKRTAERERDRGKLRCLLIGGRWKVRVGELHSYLRRMETESAR